VGEVPELVEISRIGGVRLSKFGSSALSVQAGGGKLDMFDKLKG
jgi:hypothetical protein